MNHHNHNNHVNHFNNHVKSKSEVRAPFFGNSSSNLAAKWQPMEKKWPFVLIYGHLSLFQIQVGLGDWILQICSAA